MSAEQQSDLLKQQAWLAGQVYHAAETEARTDAAAQSPTAWLQQQQALMKEQATAFLIQQEQQRMNFVLQQQKQFELQTQAVLAQQSQQQPPQQPVSMAEAGLHGMMSPGPVQDAMLLQQQQVKAFEEKQEQEERQRLEAERLAEEHRRQQEERMLQEQQELLATQEEAERQDRENAVENQRLAEELYQVEKRAEALRLAMISKSSASKAGGIPARPNHLYVIPPNWPQDVLIPPIPPPVPPKAQPCQPATPPARSRSPVAVAKVSLSDKVRKLAGGDTDPKAYLRARLEAAAAMNEAMAPEEPQEPETKRQKEAGGQAVPTKAMPRATLPPKPKVSVPSPPKAPGSPAPAVGV